MTIRFRSLALPSRAGCLLLAVAEDDLFEGRELVADSVVKLF